MLSFTTSSVLQTSRELYFEVYSGMRISIVWTCDTHTVISHKYGLPYEVNHHCLNLFCNTHMKFNTVFNVYSTMFTCLQFRSNNVYIYIIVLPISWLRIPSNFKFLIANNLGWDTEKIKVSVNQRSLPIRWQHYLRMSRMYYFSFHKIRMLLLQIQV